MKKDIFKTDHIRSEEKGFLEDLLEAMPNVVDSEDVGNSTEYLDEYGCVLFVVDIVGDDEYIFRFYENEYSITGETLETVKKILHGDEK